MAKTDILIIHLNGEDVIKGCLKSIYKNTKEMDVYLLFNNTTDKSREIVEKQFPKVKIFSTNRTLGFAEASNFLAKKSKSENIVFLNNDVEVEKGWLNELKNTMKKHPNCIAVQPKIKSYYQRDRFEYAGAAGGFIDTYGYPFCRGRIFNSVEKDNKQYDDEIRLFWGCGVCLLVKRRFFLSSGGFDEDFFMYAEELDFCWRANLFGKEIWFSPKSIIYHMGSFSIKKQKLNFKKEYLISKNHLILLFKNYSLISLIKVMPLRVLLEVISAIRYFPGKTIASLRSFVAIPFILAFKTMKKRRQIQALRKVPDRSLNKLMLDGSIVWEYFLRGKRTFKQINIGK